MRSVYLLVGAIFAVELGYYLHGLVAKAGDPCDLHEIDRAPFCTVCRTVDPPVARNGTCCGRKPELTEVCVKVCFICEVCGRRRLVDGPCCRGARIIRIEVKSPLVFRCDGCGALGTAEGECANPSCRQEGFRIQKCCVDSGRWPHGGELARQ
jgi:hypothetical protein